MSIFNIFRKKSKPQPEGVAIEVMGKTYVATPREAPTDEQRRKAEQRRQERKEKARRMEQRDKWLAIHAGMAAYAQWEGIGSDTYPDERTAEALKHANAEIRQLKGDPDFDDCMKTAVAEYRKSHGKAPTAAQKRFAEQPEDYDTERMVAEKWAAYIAGYRDYWEGQIAQLKRKSAVSNRRRYLLEHLDALIDKASSLSLDEAAGQLKEYKRYNERMLTP